MNRDHLSMTVLMLIVFSTLTGKAQDIPDGPYFGQELPGLIPEVFAPGIISVEGSRERSLALSPNGDELFFTRGSGWPYSRIMHMKKFDGEWSMPETAFFAQNAWATEATFSPDGRHLYFSTSRGKSDIRYYNLWRITKEPNGWSEPESLFDIGGNTIMEFHPTVTRDGTLYFCYWDYPRQTGDIYVSRLINGQYTDPVIVGYPISTQYSDVNPFVDPNERYLLFASNRPGGHGGADIYVSFKNDDETWSFPRNLGPAVNTPYGDDVGDISPDGRYWFYTLDNDIYWMDVRAVSLDPNASTQDPIVLMQDDFEHGLDQWDITDPTLAQIVTTGHSGNHALSLTPNSTTHCILFKDSAICGNVRIEGDLLFTSSDHNYMGLVYHYYDNGSRTDYGCIYIKGNSSYIRVNPHCDGNASRALYEEYKTDLTGISAIRINQWQHFKAEIIGPTCHFYVGDMNTPQVTFDYHGRYRGRIGFKPRLLGSECHLDNIRVTFSNTFSYQGPNLPMGVQYNPEQLISNWDAIGPFLQRSSNVENDVFNDQTTYTQDGQSYEWQHFDTDQRGCMLAGHICEYDGPNHLAYFHSTLSSDIEKRATLSFSTTNRLHIWLNEVLIGTIPEQNYAWYDFWENSQHRGHSLNITLNPGDNDLLVLVNGGNYGGDGFYARIQY